MSIKHVPNRRFVSGECSKTLVLLDKKQRETKPKEAAHWTWADNYRNWVMPCRATQCRIFFVRETLDGDIHLRHSSFASLLIPNLGRVNFPPESVTPRVPNCFTFRRKCTPKVLDPWLLNWQTQWTESKITAEFLAAICPVFQSNTLFLLTSLFYRKYEYYNFLLFFIVLL